MLTILTSTAEAICDQDLHAHVPCAEALAFMNTAASSCLPPKRPTGTYAT
jgi:hypothetical protein